MMDRRHVLQVGVLTSIGLGATAACNRTQQSPPPAPPTANAVQADEIALVAAYDAALQASDAVVRPTYQRIRDEHAAHLRALGWQTEVTATASAGPVPGRRALRRAEAAASRSRQEAAIAETDAEQAQILALIAASEAQHVVTLDAL